MFAVVMDNYDNYDNYDICSQSCKLPVTPPQGYRFRKLLGCGNFCKVFEAEHEDDPGHTFALKVLSLGKQCNAELRAVRVYRRHA
jgi:hypothetical protein